MADTVHALLEEAVRRFPDRPAVDFLGRRTLYRDLSGLVDRAARGFQALGVGKGTRVGLCLPNTPYFVICYFAVLKAGGVVVNFNPLYVERELTVLARESGTRLMVTLDLRQIAARVAALPDLDRIVLCSLGAALPVIKGVAFTLFKRTERLDLAGDPRLVPFARLIADRTPPAPVAVSALDLAVLQYTGGTTGTPKGAMLSHGNLIANVEQLLLRVPDIRPGDERMLGVLPLFHVFAMTVVMNLGIRLGSELILLPRFEVGPLLKTIARRRPTLFPGVPTIFATLNEAIALAPQDLSSIRYCLSGGAPLPAEVAVRFEALTGCRLVEGYGLSEASPVVTCNPTGRAKPGSIGPPLDGTVVEIRSLDDPHKRLGPGEKGEICVRGPQVMSGYWQRPEDSAAAFVDGALRTGDVGMIDEDGYVFLLDRIKDMILCSGYNVYPRAIEEALYQHPDVVEAVAIGIPDPHRGQSPKAFVRLRAGAAVTPDALRAFLTDYLSPIEMPKHIEIRDTLPKTMIGKLSKKELVQEELGHG